MYVWMSLEWAKLHHPPSTFGGCYLFMAGVYKLCQTVVINMYKDNIKDFFVGVLANKINARQCPNKVLLSSAVDEDESIHCNTKWIWKFIILIILIGNAFQSKAADTNQKANKSSVVDTRGYC